MHRSSGVFAVSSTGKSCCNVDSCNIHLLSSDRAQDSCHQSGNPPLWTPDRRHCCTNLPSDQWNHEARALIKTGSCHHCKPHSITPATWTSNGQMCSSASGYEQVKDCLIMIRDTLLGNKCPGVLVGDRGSVSPRTSCRQVHVHRSSVQHVAISRS